MLLVKCGGWLGVKGGVGDAENDRDRDVPTDRCRDNDDMLVYSTKPVGGSSVIAAGAIGLFWWQISPPNRLVNLYRGRGGTPVWKEASLNCRPVWMVRVLVLGGDRARSNLMDHDLSIWKL